MWKEAFSSLGDGIWLNAAHQGPLPDVAARAGREAIARKQNPRLIEDGSFREVPEALRAEIAALIGARGEDIVLANSASYGLHLLARAFKWRRGDEVLTVQGDFPSNRLPWRLAEREGVRVREVGGEGSYPQTDEIAAAVSDRTRLICVSWVHSFSGARIDISELGRLCRARRIRLVVNASQAIGARDFDVTKASVDAVISVGFKWLCGPYGTGFLWLSPEFLSRLRRLKHYWLRRIGLAGLSAQDGRVHSPDAQCAADYDIFGTANFLNFESWRAALGLLNEIGLDAIEAHNETLVHALLDSVDETRFELCSPRQQSRRSSLVFLSPKGRRKPQEIVNRLAAEDIHVAERGGQIRISPHFYNDIDEVVAGAEALNAKVRR